MSYVELKEIKLWNILQTTIPIMMKMGGLDISEASRISHDHAICQKLLGEKSITRKCP